MKLSAKIPTDFYQEASNCTREAFDDTWFEMGFEDVGQISWHSVKPFLVKLVEIEAVLTEERR